MSDTVLANALHDGGVIAPVLIPVAHVVVAWVVDAAPVTATNIAWMSIDNHPADQLDLF